MAGLTCDIHRVVVDVVVAMGCGTWQSMQSNRPSWTGTCTPCPGVLWVVGIAVPRVALRAALLVGRDGHTEVVDQVALADIGAGLIAFEVGRFTEPLPVCGAEHVLPRLVVALEALGRDRFSSRDSRCRDRGKPALIFVVGDQGSAAVAAAKSAYRTLGWEKL